MRLECIHGPGSLILVIINMSRITFVITYFSAPVHAVAKHGNVRAMKLLVEHDAELDLVFEDIYHQYSAAVPINIAAHGWFL